MSPPPLTSSWPVPRHTLEAWNGWDRLRETAGGLLRGALWQTVRGWLGLFHRLTIHGQENWPVAPPFVLVANHSSHLDTLVLAAALPSQLRAHLRPLAAADVFFRTPL